ncbi:RDD family protein [Mucilaginibacter sp. ZT4R22]|uniref:RDD family protein n=1 Tax=Mucilaginibacter pankratovii TaxID=2772110 RepID=A0ABR7WQC2_9SPHI|nr:RDD family protein [Mucilaginibacter pankratovii]MBD1364510.1 RDD family protein [Mucilaginibacter pankratovii]
MVKKISEIRIEKTVRRPAMDEYGNRYYEELTFQMKYNPRIESHFPRAWAKCIDLLIFFLPTLQFIHNFWLSMAIAIALVDIYGTISEHKRGDTLGKRLLGLKVIDDTGNYPGFWLSLKRNALAIFDLTPLHGTRIRFPVAGESTFRYNMNLNNRLCQTYIVEAFRLSEIQALQRKEDIPL